MINNSKSKLMFITLLLMILLISSAYAFLMPTVNAAELDLQEKAVSVLSDVVGLETEHYTTSQDITQLDSQFSGYQQIETSTYFTSEEGSLRVTCSYIKDTLKLVYLSDVEGEHSLKKPAVNTVEMAKGLLERYQNYAGDSLYGELASMLDDVNAKTDLTKYVGNIKFEVSGSDQSTVKYTWTYIDDNGVLAESKNVILAYEQGQLKGFFNNWPLYTIVDTTPKISSEEATAIAIEASKSYTYQVTDENDAEITVSGFTIASESLGRAKLIYVNNKEQDYARGGDPFKLYLAWHVPLGFDEFYPGDVSGMTVILWADTGEVCGMNRVITDAGLASSEDTEADAGNEATLQTVNQQSIMLPAAFVIAAVICMVLLVTYKRATLVSKKLFSKCWAMLLCTIVMFGVMLSTPIANAASLTGRSRIYACVDGDGYDDDGDADQYERIATAYVCNHVGNLSVDAGYVTSNMYGPYGTTATNVVNNAGSDEQNYMGTIVFHAGHLYAFNTAYQDNDGEPIYAADIYDETELGRHFFIFIWVCSQALNAEEGSMASAWTHRDNGGGGQYMTEVYTEEGYNSSDGGGQCYIGFQGFSPMLSNHYDAIGGNYSVFYEHNTESSDVGPAKEFIVFFYYYALVEGYSVRNALDLASSAYFDCDYSSSVLNTGYNSWWPGGEKWKNTNTSYLNASGYYPRDYPVPYEENRMKVFGDANIKLYQPLLTLSASDGLSPTFYIDGQPYSVGDYRLLSDFYEFSVSDIPNYAFSHFNYKGEIYGSNPTIQIASDGELTAVYTWDPTYYTLSISAGEGGTTLSPYTPGDHQCLSYTYAHVEAVPDNDSMVFDGWLLDDVEMGCNPTIKVYMDEPHTLEAVFTTKPDYNWVSSINDYNEYVNAPENLVGWRPDGFFAGLAGFGPYEVYGWIEATMNSQATGHIYMYGCCSSGYPGHLYVYVSSNGYNWDLVSSPYVSSTSPYWIDCGTYQSTFNYIKVTVENSQEWPAILLDSVRVEPIAYYNLTISSGAGGSTSPSPGVYEYQESTQVPVTANANDNYVFDHWLLDGNPYTQNPITVTMNDHHTLQAFFTYAPSHYWVSSIDDYDGPVSNPANLVGSETDGQFAGLEGYGPYEYYGWISGAMDSQATGHIYMYGCCASGYPGHLYVYVSSNGYNWNYVSATYVSATSPYWIDCGTYQSTFNYIKVTVESPTEFVAIGIDAVRVEP